MKDNLAIIAFLIGLFFLGYFVGRESIRWQAESEFKQATVKLYDQIGKAIRESSQSQPSAN